MIYKQNCTFCHQDWLTEVINTTINNSKCLIRKATFSLDINFRIVKKKQQHVTGQENSSELWQSNEWLLIRSLHHKGAAEAFKSVRVSEGDFTGFLKHFAAVSCMFTMVQISQLIMPSPECHSVAALQCDCRFTPNRSFPSRGFIENHTLTTTKTPVVSVWGHQSSLKVFFVINTLLFSDFAVLKILQCMNWNKLN